MNIASNTFTLESVHGLKQTVVLVPASQQAPSDQTPAATKPAAVEEKQQATLVFPSLVLPR